MKKRLMQSNFLGDGQKTEEDQRAEKGSTLRCPHLWLTPTKPWIWSQTAPAQSPKPKANESQEAPQELVGFFTHW